LFFNAIYNPHFGTVASIKQLCDLFCKATGRCVMLGNVALRFVNVSPELQLGLITTFSNSLRTA